MRKFNFVARVAVAVSSISAAGLALAQAVPTPPTTATALAQTVDLSDAKGAGLVVVGLMVSAGVVLWGARLVMSKFKPKI